MFLSDIKVSFMSDTGGENLTLMLKVFAFPYSRSLVLCLVELEKVFFMLFTLIGSFRNLIILRTSVSVLPLGSGDTCIPPFGPKERLLT